MGLSEHLERLNANGFSVVESIFDAAEVQRTIDKLESAIAADSDSSIKSRGKVYAARNLIDSLAIAVISVTCHTCHFWQLAFKR